MKQVSMLELANLTDTDRETVRRRLDGVPFKPGPKRAKLYESPMALRLVLGISDAGDGDTAGMSPQDALAVTRKKEIELNMEVTRKERIPLDVVEAVNNEALGNVAGMLKAHENKKLTAQSIRDILAECRRMGEALRDG